MGSALSHNHAAFTVDEIAQATGGRVIAVVSRRADGVFTDSRTPQAGGLFVPLSGDRFDGHDFLAAVVQQGVAAVLVGPGRAAPLGVTAVEVPDTLRALGDLAAMHRRRLDPKVIAITGSVGKTSTKDMVAAICGVVAPTLMTRGNLNNLVGTPITLLELGAEHRFAVVELGTSRPGEIARLAAICAPTAGLITRIGSSHIEGLGSIEGVQAEKGALFDALSVDGTGVINLADGRVAAMTDRSRRAVTYGTAEADVRPLAVRNLGVDGAVIVVRTPEGRFEAHLHLLGAHQVDNAVAAAAAAIALGIHPADIARGLESVRPAAGRLKPVRTRAGVLVLDDTYNANPESMSAAIDALVQIAPAARRLAILGDMLELGHEGVIAHRQVGAEVARAGVHLLIACGLSARAVADGAREAGLADEQLRLAPDSVAASGLATELVRPGDAVLVKGSRGMRMERVVAALAAPAGGSA